MRLWQKLSLLSILMVALSTGVCSLLMLLHAGKSSLNAAVGHALSDQAVRVSAWTQAIGHELSGTGGNPTAKRSLAKYLAGRFAGENAALLSGEDVIYNTSAIGPAAYLPKPQATQYIIADIDGRSLLIAGSGIEVAGTDYALYTLHDLSPVYSGMRAMARRFSLINLAVILTAGGAALFLTRLVLSPIAALKRSTGLIAQGVYDRRVQAGGQDEIGELAADFNRMAEAVEARVKQLEEEAERQTLFMSALTHELKTPMTAISANAQTLLYTRLSGEEQTEAAESIDEACTRVERLSQKLMRLIGLRQDASLPLAPHKVSALFATAQKACQAQLDQRGLRLVVENHMGELPMDMDLLVSLLVNLIDNAGKASQAGDTVWLKGEGNTLSVRDTGRGIPEGELTKITQPFYMVDKSRARKDGGMGLGLALCGEIARLHHARLEFESELGVGTMAKVVFDYEG